MSSLRQIKEAMVAAMQPVAAEIEGLQLSPYYNTNATPPSVDILPSDPHQTGLAFGGPNRMLFYTVRARTTTADQQAGQQALDRLLDVEDPASLEVALTSDQTLGGVVQSLGVVETASPGSESTGRIH